jgi:NADH-quinone oxidoreductase subunit L
MYQFLWLIPAIPLFSFVLLTLLSGSGISKRTVAVIGVGSVGISALLTGLIGINFMIAPPPGHIYLQSLWNWMIVDGFSAQIAFYLDDLSLIMMLVITFVGFLIHLYSAEFMADDDGHTRFFSYMNLFVGSMLILVLADNFVFLYLGWEAVGLCSFLLIGFWYHDPANGRAARKAFIVTRVGDAAMAIGLFLLFDHLGTLQIQQVMRSAIQQWPVGAGLAIAATGLLLVGAMGKSAQVPLQIWLPDAMAGPSPVSALIHAATMVTAGVYLIARTYALFSLAPQVLTAVAVIGTATLIIGGFSALVQQDIKRVLAYSTISQVGYMFLALGVGAWSAAIFHFMTHAFFKALLFLAAGVVISRLHHEHNMYLMGGLRKRMPLVFWTFLIGAASLSALPLITAGFYSKDQILWNVWSSALGGPLLWVFALLGALLTAIYAFRMVFLTFYGKAQPLVEELSPIKPPGWRIAIPLVVLAALSIGAGFINTPETLGNRPLLSDFLSHSLPQVQLVSSSITLQLILQIVAAITVFLGIGIAYLAVLRSPQVVERIKATPAGSALYKLWFDDWGFDRLDNEFIVYPFVWLARQDKNDIIDRFFDWVATLNRRFSRFLGQTQTGRLSYYLLGLALGAVLTIALVVLR